MGIRRIVDPKPYYYYKRVIIVTRNTDTEILGNMT
jgi:hypothetical protein